MKKILFCMTHIKMGGVEKVLCEYILGLKTKKEFDITVFSKEKVSEKYFLDFFEKNGIKFKDDFLISQSKYKHFFIIKIFIKIYRLIYLKQISKILNQYDVIIDFSNLSWSKELKKCRKKKIAWIHGSFLFFKSAGLLKKILATNYNKIVCLSNSLKKDIIKTESKLINKLSVIYNPINQTEIKKLSQNKNVIINDAPYFIAIQRLDNNDKDVKTIIDAFNMFQSLNSEYKLYIVGDGPDKRFLMNYAKENKNIIFCGQLNNPYPLLKNAKALILSSRRNLGEGQGQVLIEAQTLGVCVISSDVKSGVREIVMYQRSGILFEAENSISLSKKMKFVVENKDAVQTLIKNASKNINRFSVEKAIDSFITLIRD